MTGRRAIGKEKPATREQQAREAEQDEVRFHVRTVAAGGSDARTAAQEVRYAKGAERSAVVVRRFWSPGLEDGWKREEEMESVR